MTATTPSFATFWAGKTVSPFEAACIASFLSHGYEYTVYSYDKMENLPEGTQLRDAREITPESNVSRFLIEGRPSLSHFADMFRYGLLSKTDHIWVDTDMLLLRPFALANYDRLIAREDAKTICIGILKIDRTDPKLKTLIAEAEALRDRDLVWGDTGARLVSTIFRGSETLTNSYDPRFFFPVHYDDAWKVFLPEFNDECTELCRSAYTLHLWNDRVVKLGVWKRFCPPTGSFLERQFRAQGSLRFFDDVYPADVMQNMVKNWRGELGLRQWMHRAIPSIQLTLGRRFKLST